MRQDLAHLRHCAHLFLWWVVYAHKADYLRFGQKRDQDHTPDLLRVGDVGLHRQSWAALRRQLNEAEEAVSKRDARQEPIPKPSRPIRAGDLVEFPGVRQPAEVVSVGKDGTLQLKAGILKMKAKADEVRLIEDDERAARKKTPAVTIRQNADRALRASAARELDIRGMETLEAESVVDNFISAAVMGKLDEVTIIHGKGTGALRKAVHDILRRNKAVKSFRLGVYGEGESGVTVVTLK